MKHLSYLSIVIILSSCSSNPSYVNLDKKALGYTDTPIAPGLTKVEVEINNEPWANNSFVHSNFVRRAHQLCPSGYTVIDEFQSSGSDGNYNPISMSQSIGTYKSGYVLCNDSTISVNQAHRIIDDLKPKPVVIDKNSVKSKYREACTSENIDIDALYEAGDNLLSVGAYDEAFICYSSIIKLPAGDHKKSEAYKQLAVMYETGLGVTESLEKAKYYYRLSGLIE